MNSADKAAAPTNIEAAEKTYRMTDLLYDRGWSRKMIKELVKPDVTKKRGRQIIKLYRESQVLEAERKAGFTPCSKARPSYKKPVVRREAPKGMENNSISSLPIEIQSRIVHLQTIIPFYSPNDLTKKAVEEYNHRALRENRPLIGTKVSPGYVIDVVKIKFLIRRVLEVKPTANQPEILKAIKLVYPYMSVAVDRQIKALLSPRRRPVRRPMMIASAS